MEELHMAPQPKTREVFISYTQSAPDDAQLAVDLGNALTEAHHRVFLDRNLDAGITWQPAADKAIQSAYAFVVLLSEKALESEYLWAEVHRALELCRLEKGPSRVIPIRVAFDGSLPLGLNRLDRFHQIRWAQNRTAEVILEVQRSIEKDTVEPANSEGWPGPPSPPIPPFSDTVFHTYQTPKTFEVLLEGAAAARFTSRTEDVKRGVQGVRRALDRLCLKYITAPPGERHEGRDQLMALAKAGQQLKQTIFGSPHRADQIEKLLRAPTGIRQCWFVMLNSLAIRSRKMRDGSDMTAVHVPWGLLFDWPSDRDAKLGNDDLKNGFWSSKYDVCTILPQSEDPRPLDEALNLELKPAQILGVFNEAAVAYASDRGPQGWPKDSVCFSIKALRTKLRDIDDALLYFFCHSDDDALQLGSKAMATTEHLTPQMLRQWMSKRQTDEHRAFFFLNGCMTCATPKGIDWLSATEHMKFLGIIVTEAIVPTRFAWNFGRDLLRHTFVEGKTPVAAMRDLRRLHWPLGLVYGLYSFTKSAVVKADGLDLPTPTGENYSELTFGKESHATLPFGRTDD
jgi:hypothetical protein